MRQALNKSGLEGDEREALEAAITGHADVIALVNGQGDEIGWTTRQVREEEQAIIGAAERIGAASAPALRGRRAAPGSTPAPLLPEQRAAADRDHRRPAAGHRHRPGRDRQKLYPEHGAARLSRRKATG